MITKNSTLHTRGLVILLLAISMTIYWVLGKLINIYHYAVVGAIYEILWLPMLVMMAVVPVLALYFMMKEGFSFRSLHFYAILIVTVLVIFLTS